MDYYANRKWSLRHLCWCNLLDQKQLKSSCSRPLMHLLICTHRSVQWPSVDISVPGINPHTQSSVEIDWCFVHKGIPLDPVALILLCQLWTHWPQMNAKRTTSSLYRCRLKMQFAIIDQMVPTFYQLSGWCHWFHIKTNQHPIFSGVYVAPEFKTH